MAEAPRILFLCDALQVPPRLGFELHLVRLAEALSSQVPVGALVRRRRGESVTGLPAGVRWTVLEPGSGIGAKLAYRAAAMGLAREPATLPDGSVLWIRSVTTAGLLAPSFAGLRLRERGIRTVFDAASFGRLEARGGVHAVRDLTLAAWEERLWGAFDRIRTLCPSMRDYLVARGVAPDRVRIVPVGCESRPAERRGSADGRRILYVGSERSWQGLPLLVQAMRELHGRGSAPTVTVAGAAAGEAPPPNVHYLGRVPSEETKQLYESHDLLVVPRLRSRLTDTVLPMKVVEALPFGIPILATALRPIRDVVGSEAAAYLDDPEPMALANALEELLADPARRARMSDAAFERARAYRWETVAADAVRDLLPTVP